ncbi:hypothetical protein CTH_2302 [Carboxydocella thermautotrophica]|nr:hypothetical protein CTH_2302 [Carboxydocella thermautotrophica]
MRNSWFEEVLISQIQLLIEWNKKLVDPEQVRKNIETIVLALRLLNE